MKKLIVAETFYSLQCEGRSVGTPAVFLRLGGCNLLCKGDHWTCDTIDVWKNGKAKEFEDVLPETFIDRLVKGAHLVITGGEPLLQQEVLCQYIDWIFQEYRFHPFIEVETNGTILPNFYLQSCVSYWNVSPKLSNSNEPAHKRINEVALDFFEKQGEKTIYKFVVKNEGDVMEVFQDFGFLEVDRIMMMPAGSSREELELVRLEVANICIRLGIRYSERLHIVIWNQKTGV
jgi:7-carboxy-7-deazaguanine synthase